MTIRGRYRYNDPDLPEFDARYEDRKLTKDYMDKVTYMIDVIKQQIDEIEAIRHVIPNPNEWGTRYNHQNSKGSSNNYYDPKRDSFNSQMSTVLPVKRDAINKLIEVNAGFVNHVQNLLGKKIGMEQEGYKEGVDNKIYEDTFARVRRNIRKTDSLLNSIWSQYFDNDGWCKMSCQVACQAACQLACQSCQYNTCHNQNCGGWS